MTENYTFNADATFINRPSHTVIKDFQNKYLSSGQDGSSELMAQMGKLVELIATSTDVGRGDRDDSLRALDAMAGEVRAGSADRVSVRGRLQVIREITQQAADISVPAMATIGALLKAFGIG